MPSVPPSSYPIIIVRRNDWFGFNFPGWARWAAAAVVLLLFIILILVTLWCLAKRRTKKQQEQGIPQPMNASGTAPVTNLESILEEGKRIATPVIQNVSRAITNITKPPPPPPQPTYIVLQPQHPNQQPTVVPVYPPTQGGVVYVQQGVDGQMQVQQIPNAYVMAAPTTAAPGTLPPQQQQQQQGGYISDLPAFKPSSGPSSSSDSVPPPVPPRDR
jgi:hypothetical protein